MNNEDLQSILFIKSLLFLFFFFVLLILASAIPQTEHVPIHSIFFILPLIGVFLYQALSLIRLLKQFKQE